jgi:hypothetical protein
MSRVKNLPAAHFAFLLAAQDALFPGGVIFKMVKQGFRAKSCKFIVR